VPHKQLVDDPEDGTWEHSEAEESELAERKWTARFQSELFSGKTFVQTLMNLSQSVEPLTIEICSHLGAPREVFFGRFESFLFDPFALRLALGVSIFPGLSSCNFI
jgi:hypothetical protein